MVRWSRSDRMRSRLERARSTADAARSMRQTESCRPPLLLQLPQTEASERHTTTIIINTNAATAMAEMAMAVAKQTARDQGVRSRAAGQVDLARRRLARPARARAQCCSATTKLQHQCQSSRTRPRRLERALRLQLLQSPRRHTRSQTSRGRTLASRSRQRQCARWRSWRSTRSGATSTTTTKDDAREASTRQASVHETRPDWRLRRVDQGVSDAVESQAAACVPSKSTRHCSCIAHVVPTATRCTAGVVMLCFVHLAQPRIRIRPVDSCRTREQQ